MKTFCPLVLLLFFFASLGTSYGQTDKEQRKKSNRYLKKTRKRRDNNEKLLDIQLVYNLDCNLKLDRARTFFEKGLLEKIPPLLHNCTEDPSISKATRLAILKLLTETHLFLGQEALADKHYGHLLRLDPFYQPQEQVDHPELVYFANQYTQYAPFSLGIKSGIQFSQVSSTRQFVESSRVEKVDDVYAGIWYMSGGAFLSYTPRRIENLSVVLEVLYAKLGYNYEGKMSLNSNLGTANLVFSERTRIWQFPLSIKYLFGDKDLCPYASVGVIPSLSSLARMENLRITIQENGNFSQKQNTGLDISHQAGIPLRKFFTFSTQLSLGAQLQVRSVYVFAELRYRKMWSNIVQSQNRSSNDILVNDFYHLDNDFSIHDLGLSIGVAYSFYRSVR